MTVLTDKTIGKRDFAEKVLKLFCRDPQQISRSLYLYGEPEQMEILFDAIETLFRQSHPDAVIKRRTGSALTEEVLQSILDGDRARLVSELSACDLLLVDNIQTIAHRESTMEFVYSVLDRLVCRHSCFVVSGNAALREIPGLSDRIRALLEGALVIGVN